MNNRQQLIQVLEQAPDDQIETVIDFLHRDQATGNNHPLAKFSDILSDSEAQELQQAIKTECRQLVRIASPTKTAYNI